MSKMNAAKHTPGPWRPGQEVQFGPRFSGVTIRGSSTVAIVVEGSGRADANARLIAAAPAMLEVLQQVADHFVGTDSPLGILAHDAIAQAPTDYTP